MQCRVIRRMLLTAKDIFYPRQYTDDGGLWDIFLKFKSPSPPPPTQDLTRDRMKRLTSLSACSGEENNSCIIPRNCASSPSYVLYICTSTHYLVYSIQFFKCSKVYICFTNLFYCSTQGSIYWKIPPPRGGGNKYGLMGKKYHENNSRASRQKRRKRKKGQGKRKDK